MSSFFSPFTPGHVNLVNACYPPTSVLLAPGSTCQPLPQELSRLTYYASNVADSSGKLSKVAIELEKRASSESRKAQGGNAKARAQMLVTVSIFKAITNECKRDVGLFTKMLISATRDALTCLPNDLEVQARVSSLFTAWATYTDGSIIGRDLRVTNEYIFLLKTFHERCTATGKDSEQVHRMRLIGVAAMTAAVSSDAFYAASTEFPKQVEIAIPALVASLHEAGTEALKAESSVVSADPAPNSPYLSEFQPRPVMDRRAASIHAHIDGQKGPELSDVVNASLRALRALLGRCNGGQVGKVVDAILLTIDKSKGHLWEDKNLGEWYAERVIEWSQYQYRYAVPTKLIEKLLAIQDSPTPSPKHFTLVQMLISIFTSPFPLINLSTSEVISSLIAVILRRVSINANDELLPSLVECASSLGTHVYYADQIHDLAEEVVSRIVSVQVNGVLGRGRTSNEPAREAALSCLLSVLSGLTEAADRHAAKHRAKLAEEGELAEGEGELEGHATPDAQTTENGSRPPSESTTTTMRAARRNKVSPESWQETLALMCESNYNIRAMYARGLASFVQREVKKEPFVEQESSGASASSPTASTSSLAPRKKVKVVVDPSFKASSRPSILASDPVSRFLNALHASAYTLAASISPNKPAVGSTKPTISEHLAALDALNAGAGVGAGPVASINIIPPSTSNLPSAEGNTPDVNVPTAIDFAVHEATAPNSPTGLDANQPPMTAGSSASNTSYQPPGTATTTGGDAPSRRHSRHNGRKLSVALNLLEGSQAEVTATLSDFSLLQYILVTTHTQVPCRAVLTGVPMLLALAQLTRKLVVSQECIGGVRAIRELVCRTWLVIGEIWDIPPVVESASNALKALGDEILPELPSIPPTRINSQEKPILFPEPPRPLASESCGIIDAEVVLPALASCVGLQAITGLDRQGLLRRFTIEWTIEAALKDSVEHTSNQDILRGETPFLKLSPALMHIDNVSLASLARSTGGGVGVSELREALGRGGASNPALATSSMKSSTIDRRSSIGNSAGRSARRSISGKSNTSAALSGGAGDRVQPLEPLAISRIKSKRGRAPPSEVRDVLNKLGIGKQSGGSTLLKTPFPSQSQKDKDPASLVEANGKAQEPMVEPPY